MNRVSMFLLSFLMIFILTFVCINNRIVLADEGQAQVAASEGSTISTESINNAKESVRNSGKQILDAVSWFGYAIAFGMIIYIGIKYMLGAAEAKADMKKHIVAWLIGAFIVFMASTITRWTINIFNIGDGTGLAEDIVDAAQQIINQT